MFTGCRADVDDPIGVANHVDFMLDHEERIPRCLEPIERAQQRLGIGGMQPGRGFVEHVDDAEEIRTHLRR